MSLLGKHIPVQVENFTEEELYNYLCLLKQNFLFNKGEALILIEYDSMRLFTIVNAVGSFILAILSHRLRSLKAGGLMFIDLISLKPFISH